jgi:hypothetical protein
MIKWFVYIGVLMILTPCLSSASTNNKHLNRDSLARFEIAMSLSIDTIKKPKIKEVAKAKNQPKPEKVDQTGTTAPDTSKRKRQRRPPGLERPPEIPRRNGP